MDANSPQTVLENLNQLDRVDASEGAGFRQDAQEMLANPEVSFSWRQAIADRLNLINRLIGKQNVGANDSY